MRFILNSGGNHLGHLYLHQLLIPLRNAHINTLWDIGQGQPTVICDGQLGFTSTQKSPKKILIPDFNSSETSDVLH